MQTPMYLPAGFCGTARDPAMMTKNTIPGNKLFFEISEVAALQPYEPENSNSAAVGPLLADQFMRGFNLFYLFDIACIPHTIPLARLGELQQF